MHTLLVVVTQVIAAAVAHPQPTLVVDRIEDDTAVIEVAGGETWIDLPITTLPPDSTEGSRLQLVHAGP